MVAFAYIALFGWPLVAIWAFKKWPPEKALLVTIVGGYLLLPLKTSVDLPVLPALQKDSVPAFIALLMTLTAGALMPKNSRYFPKGAIGRLLLIVLILGTFLTVLQNSEPLIYGPRFIPGLRLYDGFALVLLSLVLLLPFFLGHKLLATPNAQRGFLKFIVYAGLIYSIPALIEVRISPQLHNIFYGQHPHQFAQAYRAGGFRPTVFIGHGLEVALFFSFCALSALGLWKHGAAERKKFYLFAAIWLFVMLILCRSLGPLMITILIGSIMFFGNPRIYLLSSAVISSIALTYPALRAADLIPTEPVLRWAYNVSPERGASLNLRLVNEDALLEKANQKALFGWGAYGRNRIYLSNGADVSVVDGMWVSTFGLGGWTRYITLFGLLCLPAIFAAIQRKSLQIGPETAVLSMLLSGNLLDLIPNAALTPLTFLIVGAIWGRLSLQKIATPEEEAQTPKLQAVRNGLQYTRYPKPDTNAQAN